MCDLGITSLSMEYLVMFKVVTDVGGIEWLYHCFVPVQEIIHSLNREDCLQVHVHADKP